MSFPGSRQWCIAFAVTLSLSISVSASGAPTDIPTAIENCQKRILSLQKPDGLWAWDDVAPESNEILSTLATLSLLYSGLPETHEGVRKAIDALKATKPQYVLSTTMRCRVWALLGKEYEALLKREIQWLIDSGEVNGTWGLVERNSDKEASPWSTALAARALWEAEWSGLEVDPKIWKRIAASWSWGTPSLDTDNMYRSTGFNLIALYAPYRAKTKAVPLQPIEKLIGEIRFRADKRHLYDGELCDTLEQYAALTSVRDPALGVDHFHLGFREPRSIEKARAVNLVTAPMLLTRAMAPRWCAKLYAVEPNVTWPHALDGNYFMQRRLEMVHNGPLIWQRNSIADPADQWSKCSIVNLHGSKAIAFKPDELKNLKTFVDAGGMIFITGGKPFRISSEKLVAQLALGGKVEPLSAEFLRTLDPKLTPDKAALSRTRVLIRDNRIVLVVPTNDWAETFLQDDAKIPDFQIAQRIIIAHTTQAKGQKYSWKALAP